MPNAPMPNFEIPGQQQRGRPISLDQAEDAARSYLWRVYTWMSLGLGVTGLIGLVLMMNPTLVASILLQGRGVFFGLLIAELVLVVAFSALARRVSVFVAALMFFAYAAMNGVTIGIILSLYSPDSVASTFFVTAGTFGGMSAFGALTKRDLSSFGSFLFMGLWGLIIASVVNMFLASSALYWVTTYAGVLIFVGLTAYDTQKIKALGAGTEGTGEAQKGAIIGALILYLDFINLFLLLLRLFGRRR